MALLTFYYDVPAPKFESLDSVVYKIKKAPSFSPNNKIPYQEALQAKTSTTKEF